MMAMHLAERTAAMQPKPATKAAILDLISTDQESRFAFAMLLLVLVAAQLTGFHVLGGHFQGIVGP
jgi:hypothetical protein